MKKIAIIHEEAQLFDDFLSHTRADDIVAHKISPDQNFYLKLQQLAPEVIFIGGKFRGRSTAAYIAKVREQFSRHSTRIMVFGNSTNIGEIADYIKSGADDFVYQNFDPATLVLRVRYQLQEKMAFKPKDLQTEPLQIPAAFDLVFECAKILSETENAFSAAQETVKKIHSLFHATRVSLCVAKNAHAQSALTLFSSDRNDLAPIPTDLSKYLEVREVLLKEEILLIKDIDENPLTRGIKEKVRDIQVDSIALFPVRFNAKASGVLSVRMKEKDFYISKNHLKTLYFAGILLGTRLSADERFKALCT